jgi:hypothetical protein
MGSEINKIRTAISPIVRQWRGFLHTPAPPCGVAGVCGPGGSWSGAPDARLTDGFDFAVRVVGDNRETVVQKS